MDHSKLSSEEKAQLVALHQKAGDAEFKILDEGEEQIQELAKAVNALADIVPIIAQKLDELDQKCNSFYKSWEDAYKAKGRMDGIGGLHEKLKGMDGYGDLEKFYSESEGGDFKEELYDLMSEAKEAAAKAVEGQEASPFDEDGFIKSALDAVRGKIESAKGFGAKPEAVVETTKVETAPIDEAAKEAADEAAAAEQGASVGREAKAMRAMRSQKK